ncbi:MAG: N-acetyltransferase [Desulfatibacillaceae bacterium]
MIRKATIQDIRQIHGLLQNFANKGELLPRPLSSLYDHVRDYVVYEPEQGCIAGCCALQICWEDLAEIRSLAVSEPHWSRGVGSRLLAFALDEARKFKIRKVFALTYRPGFFERHGFAVVDKSELPQKIWADCLHCVKFPDCDEIAMMREVDPEPGEQAG